MYELGEQFKFDLNKSTANKECIFQGQKYRITILTERLIRLEYSESGKFLDNPTELIWYRNFPKPMFTVEQTDKILNIKTKYFELNYVKDKKFYGGKISPSQNLKISLLGTDKSWYYGHPEIRNYSSGVFNLKDTNDKNLKKSLYSLDGFSTIDDSNSSIILENGEFKERQDKSIDIYVFLYNKDFYYCLNDYFMLTGYPPLVPRYALGNWWTKDEEYSSFDIIHLVRKFEENKIPLSLFVLNNWEETNSFEFKKNYNGMTDTIKYLNSKNIKFGLSLNIPKEFKEKSPLFEKLKTYLPANKSGNIPFNVYDARTIDAFLKLLIHPLDNIGVNFYSINTFSKNDLDMLFILKHYLYFDALKNNKKRPLIISQNFTKAPHRYSILYAGKSDVSWDTLKKIPAFNADSTNMGISFWSHDVGGTMGGIEDNELFGRFVQLATFSPILRLGSEGGKFYKREPWKWGLKTRQITTEFLRLRHKLIPYIYTEAYKYYKYGKPLIEPLYYIEPAIYDSIYRDEYFFGSSLLISPITTKKDYLMNRVIHKIYLPEGKWYDFFTGKQYKGNRKYTSFYRDQEYPVFVKAGTIIPLSLNETNNTDCPNKMEIVVFPGGNNTYSVYEDDGQTNAYQDGDYLITNIEFVYDKDQYRLTILPVGGKVGIVPKTRDYKVRFKSTKPATNISTFVAAKQVKNSYYKDDTDLVIDIENVPTNNQLTVICSGMNIEIESIKIIREDITEIISDLPIKTVIKQKIDDILFSKDFDLKKKRIEIRKLANGKDYLERKYIELLLKLLEYIKEV